MSGCDVENLVSSVQNVLLNREGCECDCPVNYGGVCCELCKFSTDTHSCMLSLPCHMTFFVSASDRHRPVRPEPVRERWQLLVWSLHVPHRIIGITLRNKYNLQFTNILVNNSHVLFF